MNKINKDELFQHVSGFFKSRGIELKEGPYTQGVQKSCELLADSINLSQEAWDQARVEMERRLDQMRQVIHERTAPKPPAAQTEPTPAQAKTAEAKPADKKAAGSKKINRTKAAPLKTKRKS